MCRAHMCKERSDASHLIREHLTFVPRHSDIVWIPQSSYSRMCIAGSIGYTENQGIL